MIKSFDCKKIRDRWERITPDGTREYPSRLRMLISIMREAFKKNPSKEFRITLTFKE